MQSSSSYCVSRTKQFFARVATDLFVGFYRSEHTVQVLLSTKLSPSLFCLALSPYPPPPSRSFPRLTYHKFTIHTRLVIRLLIRWSCCCFAHLITFIPLMFVTPVYAIGEIKCSRIWRQQATRTSHRCALGTRTDYSNCR